MADLREEIGCVTTVAVFSIFVFGYNFGIYLWFILCSKRWRMWRMMLECCETGELGVVLIGGVSVKWLIEQSVCSLTGPAPGPVPLHLIRPSCPHPSHDWW